MHLYFILFTTIIFEVLGTMLLPASQNFTKLIPTITILCSYALSFYLLSILSQKMSLAVIYASWSGLGIFSIAILSYLFYKQPLNWPSIFGLILIIVGVTTINIFKEPLP